MEFWRVYHALPYWFLAWQHRLDFCLLYTFKSSYFSFSIGFCFHFLTSQTWFLTPFHFLDISILQRRINVYFLVINKNKQSFFRLVVLSVDSKVRKLPPDKCICTTIMCLFTLWYFLTACSEKRTFGFIICSNLNVSTFYIYECIYERH